LCGYLFIKK
jgi:hypothetical protein